MRKKKKTKKSRKHALAQANKSKSSKTIRSLDLLSRKLSERNAN